MTKFFRWDDGPVDMLRKLITAGAAFAVAADKIQAAFPQNGALTRNACIGRAHRMKLTGPNTPPPAAARQPKPPRVRAPRPVKAAPAPKPARIPAPQPVAELVLPGGPLKFMDQKDGFCRWPLTKDTSYLKFRVCGCICKPTKPYCDEHSAKAYQPSRPRPMPQDRQNATHASAMFFKERV